MESVAEPEVHHQSPSGRRHGEKARWLAEIRLWFGAGHACRTRARHAWRHLVAERLEQQGEGAVEVVAVHSSRPRTIRAADIGRIDGGRAVEPDLQRLVRHALDVRDVQRLQLVE
ncbi:hypothetical protein GCM10020219_017100 [Nonomuraea dietziae]